MFGAAARLRRLLVGLPVAPERLVAPRPANLSAEQAAAAPAATAGGRAYRSLVLVGGEENPGLLLHGFQRQLFAPVVGVFEGHPAGKILLTI